MDRRTYIFPIRVSIISIDGPRVISNRRHILKTFIEYDDIVFVLTGVYEKLDNSQSFVANVNADKKEILRGLDREDDPPLDLIWDNNCFSLVRNAIEVEIAVTVTWVSIFSAESIYSILRENVESQNVIQQQKETIRSLEELLDRPENVGSRIGYDQISKTLGH